MELGDVKGCKTLGLPEAVFIFADHRDVAPCPVDTNIHEL